MKAKQGTIECPHKGLQAWGRCAEWRKAGFKPCETCTVQGEETRPRSVGNPRSRRAVRGSAECPYCGGKKSKRAIMCQKCRSLGAG